MPSPISQEGRTLAASSGWKMSEKLNVGRGAADDGACKKESVVSKAPRVDTTCTHELWGCRLVGGDKEWLIPSAVAGRWDSRRLSALWTGEYKICGRREAEAHT